MAANSSSKRRSRRRSKSGSGCGNTTTRSKYQKGSTSRKGEKTTTTIIVRGATTHFSNRPSHVANIAAYCRSRNVKRVVIATSFAAQGINCHLERHLCEPGDAKLEPLNSFLGDEVQLDHALTGVPKPTPEQEKKALAILAKIVVAMHDVKGPVLVMCAVGRNRSFTTAFVYYLCYHGVGYSVEQNLARFKRWKGLNFDPELQSDGSQQLDKGKPWIKSLERMFESPEKSVVSQRRVTNFLKLAERAACS